jgi:hypothetical protein
MLGTLRALQPLLFQAWQIELWCFLPDCPERMAVEHEVISSGNRRRRHWNCLAHAD